MYYYIHLRKSKKKQQKPETGNTVAIVYIYIKKVKIKKNIYSALCIQIRFSTDTSWSMNKGLSKGWSHSRWDKVEKKQHNQLWYMFIVALYGKRVYST